MIDKIRRQAKHILGSPGTVVSLVAHNHEIAGSIPAGSPTKFEVKIYTKYRLDMTTVDSRNKLLCAIYRAV
jgi:hypothetical protein